MSQEFDSKVLDLIKKKGIYPYEYLSGFEKFKKELSSKEKFYSSFTDRNIGDKEYVHVLKMWNRVDMKTIKDYHELYLKCDVSLLADVSEKFRNSSLKNYGSCPGHF